MKSGAAPIKKEAKPWKVLAEPGMLEHIGTFTIPIDETDAVPIDEADCCR